MTDAEDQLANLRPGDRRGCQGRRGRQFARGFLYLGMTGAKSAIEEAISE